MLLKAEEAYEAMEIKYPGIASNSDDKLDGDNEIKNKLEVIIEKLSILV